MSLQSRTSILAGNYRRWLVVALITTSAILGQAHLALAQAAQKPATAANTPQVQTIQYLNSAPGVAYVGSKVCGTCHNSIYQEYSQTHMGRSMYLPDDPADLERASQPVTVFNNKSGHYFQVFRRGQDIYQSIYALSSSGKEAFRHTEKIAYVIGSGVNGVGYLIRRGNYLFQAPLAFYIKTQSWGLAPGYDAYDFGFSRAVTARCITCHSGQPQPASDTTSLYEDPPFKELAIGCENCHGPGELHVEARQKGEPVSGGADRTIVNPAKLPVWLATDICMSCHEEGDVQVLNAGKNFTDYRPGTPLSDILTTFKVPPTAESVGQPALLDRYMEMRLSKCFEASGGRFGCLTCHDPHSQPSPEESVTYFRAKCLICHTNESCKVPPEAREGQNPPDDCAGCHMLKQPVTLPHSSIVNHRIVASANEPYPDFAFHLTTPALPDLIDLNAAPGDENKPLPALTLMQAYRDLWLKTRSPLYEKRYLSLLDGLATTEPDNVLVLSALAQKAAKEQSADATTKAIQDLERALKLGSTSSDDHLLLAELLLVQHRPAEAINVLQKGLSLNPYYIPYYQWTTIAYLNAHNPAQAAETLKQGLDLFPENGELQALEQRMAAAGASH